MRFCPIRCQYSQQVVRWYFVTWYDLRPMYDTKKYRYCVQEQWNVKMSGHQYHTYQVVVYLYHACTKMHNMVTYLRHIFGVLLYSMDTSRIIRVGSRNYVICIAAISQDHVPVRVTRKIIRDENDMVLVLYRN